MTGVFRADADGDVPLAVNDYRHFRNVDLDGFLGRLHAAPLRYAYLTGLVG